MQKYFFAIFFDVFFRHFPSCYEKLLHFPSRCFPTFPFAIFLFAVFLFDVFHQTRIIQRKIKADRRKSAPSVKVELQSKHGITISEQTVRRRLHEVGLFGRVARKKPYVNKVNRGKRSPKHIRKNLLASGITSCDQMKEKKI